MELFEFVTEFLELKWNVFIIFMELLRFFVGLLKIMDFRLNFLWNSNFPYSLLTGG